MYSHIYVCIYAYGHKNSAIKWMFDQISSMAEKPTERGANT